MSWWKKVPWRVILEGALAWWAQREAKKPATPPPPPPPPKDPQP